MVSAGKSVIQKPGDGPIEASEYPHTGKTRHEHTGETKQ